MAAISPTYATPGLRWGLLLEDHPGAVCSFELTPGADLGIPPQFGGDQMYCVATITFPAETGKPPVSGWKAVQSERANSSDHQSDVWLKLTTKALGRALKRAGYPGDTKELKALVLWRQRDAEITAITAGTANLQLAGVDVAGAIEAAATTHNAVDADDGATPDTDADDGVTDAVVVDTEPPSQAAVTLVRAAFGNLGSKQADLRAWAREQGINVTNPATGDHADRVLRKCAELNDGEVTQPVEALDPEAIADAVAALDDTERQVLRNALPGFGIDADAFLADPAGWVWEGEQAERVTEWLTE